MVRREAEEIMKTKLSLHLVVIISMLLAALPAQAAQARPAAPALPAASSAPADLLQFTSGGHALGFAADGMYAATGTHALHVDFVDANNVQPQADSLASVDGKAAPLGHVTYANLWDGITLTYAATAGSIYTTSYSLSPGANPADIGLRYNVPLTLNEDGTLTIAFDTGAMTESAPVAWQDINSQRMSVDVSFRVSGQEVGFALGSYNPRYALTIDPSLVWNTFLGGSDYDYGTGIAVDGSGNVYVTGSSYATWGSPVRAYTGGDAFAAKLDSSGGLTWNTFLGGSGGEDDGYGIAVDGSGNVYVTGKSDATWGSPVRAYGGSGWDAFAAKLDSTGGLTWNTFLGGSGGGDISFGIAVDGSGNVYVAGTSYATWGSPVRAYTSNGDVFAAKLNASGGLTWNTFLGGSAYDYGYGIVVDGSGNVYVAGYSDATWGSPVRAYTGGADAFAAKLNASGGLTWNTFLGGSGDDVGSGIVVDGSGNVCVAGSSSATWGSPVRVYAGGDDTFVAKLNTSGGLTWNTFLGGSGGDYGYGIAVDGSGNVYVAGYSDATWGSPLRAYTSGADAFAAKLDSTGGLTLNTFLGGGGVDEGDGIAVDGSGNVYVAGYSAATWGSPVRAYTGGADAFAAKVDFTPPTVVSSLRADPNPTNAASVHFTVTFSESVTGVDTADFSLTVSGITGASVTAVSGSGATRSVTVDTGSGDGTLRLNVVDNDSIIDADSNPLGGTGAGNGNYTSGQAYTVDKTAPTVVSSLRADSNPTMATSVHFTVTFSESVTGVNTADFSLTTTGVSGASVTAVSGSGATRTVTVSTGTGNGTLRLNVVDNDSIIDAASNPLGGKGAGNGNYTSGQAYTIDKTAPMVVSSLRADSNPTMATSVHFTVTFSEAVTGVDTADFSLTTTGVSGASVTAVSGSGATRTVTVNTGIGNGTLRLNVVDNDSIRDNAGNPLGGTGAGNGNYTSGQAYTLDKTPPKVVSSVRADPNPTTATSVKFTVTFSESVTGVDTADFNLTAPGITGASVTTVSGSGATRTVTVSTGSGHGTLRLNVVDNDTIRDSAGNPLGGTGASNGNYTSGQKYTLDRDNQFRSAAAQDGWVLESSETSGKGGSLAATGTLRLGDDAANKQYRSLLYFSSAGLPDNATITKVTLKIRKAGVTGTDPFTTHGPLLADIKKGTFGASPLEIGDFQATASKTNVGHFSAVSGSTVWYQLVLGAANYPYINKTGVTQFRLRFTKDDNDDHGADYVSFYAGDATTASNRPLLIVEYTLP
jgi:predicted secreted hydrolase